jgi:hypothetical protein
MKWYDIGGVSLRVENRIHEASVMFWSRVVVIAQEINVDSLAGSCHILLSIRSFHSCKEAIVLLMYNDMLLPNRFPWSVHSVAFRDP